MMKILVNGAWRETSAPDLAACLNELGYQAAVVATAVNGEFVPAGSRATRPLTEGDRLEVVAPMQGG
jgi:sulfur carrier protein